MRTLLEAKGVFDRFRPDANGFTRLDSNEPMSGVRQGRQFDSDQRGILRITREFVLSRGRVLAIAHEKLNVDAVGASLLKL